MTRAEGILKNIKDQNHSMKIIDDKKY